MKIQECFGCESGDSFEDVSVSMQSDAGSKLTQSNDLVSCGSMGDDICNSLKALSMQDATLTENRARTSDSNELNPDNDDQDVQLSIDLKMMSLEDGGKASLPSTEASKLVIIVDQEKPPSDLEHNSRGLPQEHEDTSAEGSQSNTDFVPRGPHGGIPATPTVAAPYPWPEEWCRPLPVHYKNYYDLSQPEKFMRPNNTNGYRNGGFVVDGSVHLTTDQCNGLFNFGSTYNCQVSQTAHTGMLSGGCVTVQPLQQQPATTYSTAPYESSLPQAALFNQPDDFVDDIIQECIGHTTPDNLGVEDFFQSGDLLSSGLDDLVGNAPIPIHVHLEQSNQSDMGYFSPPHTNTLSPYSPAGTDSSMGVFTDDLSNDSQTCGNDQQQLQLLHDLNEIIAQDSPPNDGYPCSSSFVSCTPPTTTEPPAFTCDYQGITSVGHTLQSPSQSPVTQISNQDFSSMASVHPGLYHTAPGQYIIRSDPTIHPFVTVPTVVKTPASCKHDPPPKLREIRPKPPADVLTPSGNMTTNIIAGVNGSGFHVPQPLPCEEGLIKTSEDRQRHVRFCRELAEYQKPQLLFQDPEGDTLLHLAIARKELTFIAALLPRMDRDELISQMINKVNENNWTPLHMAVMTNQVATVRELIKHGALTNIPIHRRRDGSNYVFLTPLHWAASKGYQWTNMLEVLLSARDVDVHAFDSEGRTALHRAVEEHDGIQVDSRRSIYLLVQAGADIAKQDQRVGETALHYAVKKKSVEFVAWILGLVCEMVRKTTSPEQLEHRQRVALSNIINMRSNGNSGVTALQVAFNLRPEQTSQDQRIKIMELLLRNGAVLSSRTDSGLRRELSNIPELRELLKNITNSSRTCRS